MSSADPNPTGYHWHGNMLYWSTTGYGFIEKAFCWRTGGVIPAEAWDKFLHNKDVTIRRRGLEWDFDDIYIGGYTYYGGKYYAEKYHFGGLEWSTMRGPRVTDEDVFEMHAATPVCPHCGRQSSDGPMGEYSLGVTCDWCGKWYNVTMDNKGVMRYRWTIPKPVE